MNTEERAQAAHMDRAIREAVGGTTTPDLLAEVRRRVANPSAEVALPDPRLLRAAAPRTRRWLAAAAVVLGAGTLIAVAVDRADHNTDDNTSTSATAPQDPQPAKPLRSFVKSAEALSKISPDTTHLRVLRITAPDFVRLVPDLPKLVELDLDGLDGARMDTLNAEVLAKIGTFGGLRSLYLPGRPEIQGAWLKHLTGLPLLERVDLPHAQLGEEGIGHLASLPSLRRLDLSVNQALSDDALRLLIAGAPGLQWLSLAGCGSLTSVGLQQLQSLRQVKHLDVSWIRGADMTQVIGAPKLAPFLTAWRARSAEWNVRAPKPTQGVDDEVLLALAKMPLLRNLNLSGCRAVSPLGLETVASMPLRYLQLDDMPGLPEALRSILPKGVTNLSLERSSVTDASLEELAKMMLLVELRLSGCPRITDHGLGLVLRRHTLFMLSIEHCDGLTRASLQPLLEEKRLLELRTTGLRWIDAAAEKQLKALPQLMSLVHHRRR